MGTHDEALRQDAVAAAPSSHNPYAAQFQQGVAPPDLDSAAPALTSNELRRLNRRAFGFLVGVVLLVVVAALWIFSSLLNRKESAKAPIHEVVTIPAAPSPQLPPPPAPAASPKTEAIALAPELPPLPPRSASAQEPRGLTLLERRIADKAPAVGVAAKTTNAPASAAQPPYPGAWGPQGADSEQGMPPNSAYTGKPLSPTSSAQPLIRPDTLMMRGTYIRCVLETHIVTDIPGFTSCVVTEPVYSFSGKRLLLPKGSKVLGKYDTEPNGPRVAVIWDRVVTPTGIDVNMASPGVDSLGGAGHQGDLDEHWASRIGAAMLISFFSDAFKYAASQYGPSTNSVAAGGVVVQSPFESNTAQTLQNFANQAVRRAANRPATVTIHQGTVVNVYVARDVDFSGVVARY
ncbi:MAG: TrbI/VirB10 family protein [Variovorax sp.]|nr:TrbI/VirB10 family protein [Variovorax sp.]